MLVGPVATGGLTVLLVLFTVADLLAGVAVMDPEGLAARRAVDLDQEA